MRIPSWPAHPRTGLLFPLFSRQVLIGLTGLVGAVLAITWYSFEPAPDFLLLALIVVAIFVTGWLALDLFFATEAQRWTPFIGQSDRRRGRDSRVSQLRSMLGEIDAVRDGPSLARRPEPETDHIRASADQIHSIVTAVAADRLRARGLDGHGEDARALLGRDLTAYLDAPRGQRHRRMTEIEQFLNRIERI